MKKKFLIIIILFLIINTVNAKECRTITESNAVNTFLSGKTDVDVTIDGKTYKAGTPYSQIPYCNHNGSGEFMSNGACWSFAISNILRSYGSDVYSEQFAEYFCNDSSFRSALTGMNDYSNITTNSQVLDKFDVNIEDIADTMEALDEALNEGKSILASIESRGGGNIFTGSSHYVAIVLKDSDKYYVLNSTDDRSRGWISRNDIQINVIQKKGRGIYAVSPKECVTNPSSSNSSDDSDDSNSSSKGLQDDPYEDNGFGYTETKDITCKNIFMKEDGSDELNDLGEAVQGLFTLIKIATPILVLILTTIDYIKAMTNQDDAEIKKTTQRTFKRLIFGILIFLLPFLLDLIFHLLGLYDLSTCGIGVNNAELYDDTTFEREDYSN